ncbi:MAG TPA: DUF6622 family protein [Victivallales bacterium]|nr:DUF6622 family protein [Victivallales bacterium]
MLSILQGTPFWVYLIFILLIKRGISACKENTISIKKVFIAPIVVFILSLHKINIPYLYIIFFICGLVIGYLIYKKMSIIYNKDTKKIIMPGSIIPLILMIGVFVKSYSIGYLEATSPAMLHTPHIMILTDIVSGLFSGIFIGRATVIFIKTFYSKKNIGQNTV